MPVRFPPYTFFEQTGTNAARFTDKLRDGIVDFACEIWSKYPSYITENKSIGSSYARGFMTEACTPRHDPPPPPSSPFNGGQCPGVLYKVGCHWDNDDTPRVLVDNVEGAITNVVCHPPNGNYYTMTVESEGSGTLTGGNYNVYPQNLQPTDISVVRKDGQPDDCGDPEDDYTEPPPTSSDLTKILIIPLSDGTTWETQITYNQLSTSFNFPMGFILNGIYATLDVGGVTLFGSLEYHAPRTGNDPPPPGDDTASDGVGGGDTKRYPRQDYPTLPEFTSPQQENFDLPVLVCEDGVSNLNVRTVSLTPGVEGYARLMLDALNILLKSQCEGETEAVLGFPEYYPVLPGTERPAIVYIWKELVGDTWQKSTYTSTVSNPNTQAIIEAGSPNPVTRDMGKYVASLLMTDGSRLRASGVDAFEARANLGFLISRTDPSYLPLDYNSCIVTTDYPKLELRTVNLRAVEYYPYGAAGNRTPESRVYLDASQY